MSLPTATVEEFLYLVIVQGFETPFQSINDATAFTQ